MPNHSYNRENLYWGRERFDIKPLRFFYGLSDDRPAGYYQGDKEDSPYWWGDLCSKHLEYGRNLTFNTLNLARINPSMPYRDPRRDLMARWFSSTDAADVQAFNHVLQSEEQAKLERNGGFSIVSTHFGKGFVKNGELNSETRRLLDELASRNGWFPTVGELLDHLRARGTGTAIPESEWRRMQWRWAEERVGQLLRRVFARNARPSG